MVVNRDSGWGIVVKFSGRAHKERRVTGWMRRPVSLVLYQAKWANALLASAIRWTF